MSEFKGTQGKINIRQQRARHGIGKKYVLENDYFFVAEVQTCIGYTTDEEVKANAVLFSKANELLDFIKKNYKFLRLEDQEKAVKLIKEATEI